LIYKTGTAGQGRSVSAPYEKQTSTVRLPNWVVKGIARTALLETWLMLWSLPVTTEGIEALEGRLEGTQ